MASKRFQFCLNTSKKCFICFKEIEFTSSVEDHFKERKFSLQNIFRYLGIKLTNLPSLSNKSTLVLSKTEIRVGLCSDCSIIIEKFTKNHEAFEVSRMKVESSLKDILTKFKMDNEQLNSEHCDPSAQKHFKIVSELRQKVLTKSKIKSGSFLPRIIIQDLNNLQENKVSLRNSAPKGPSPPHDEQSKENKTGESTNAGVLNTVIKTEVEEEEYPETESFSVVEAVQNIKLEPDSSPEKPRKRFCKKQFLQRYSVKGHVPPEHLATLTPRNLQKLSKFSCKPCEKYFNYRRDYFRHIRMHLKLECRLCKQIFTSQDVLTFHAKTFHSTSTQEELQNNGPIQASISKDDLILLTKEQFKCPNCPKIFYDADSYKTHLFRKHADLLSSEKFKELAKFKCTHCPRYFRYKIEFSNHFKIHTRIRSFKCGCGMSFASKTLRLQHVKTHHRKPPDEKSTDLSPMLCKVCNREFRNKIALSVHRWRCHTEKKFSCKICSKKFTKEDELAQHEKSHFPNLIIVKAVK